MNEKKYVVTNPLDLAEDRNNGHEYGPYGFISRINLGKCEPEMELVARFANPCLAFSRGEVTEADVTNAYNYNRWGITPGRAKMELMKIFVPISDDGQTVRLRYISSSEFED